MIPSLNRFEFHPFTISSSPHDKFVTFHIKAVGNWTRGLLSIASNKAPAVEEGLVSKDVTRNAGNSGVSVASDAPIEMYIEGPFGTPSIDIMGDSYKVMLLICGGIGVTPCYSILKYLLHQKTHYKSGLKKVIFIWTSRNLDTFRTIELDLPSANTKQDISSNDVAHYELYLTSASTKVSAHEFGQSLIVGKRPNIPDILAKTAKLASNNGENSVGVVVSRSMVS
jgi:NADPH oxidase